MRKRKRVFNPAILGVICINVGEDYQVRHWAKQFAVSELDLRNAVERVGSVAENVRREVLTKLEA
jgi:hypothetical protein